MNELGTVNPINQEYYGTTARHYDLAYAADSRLRDLPFWIELAQKFNNVLEIACGTGRVLLPVARTGVKIDGLEYSPQFLEILTKKIKSESPDVQSRISVHPGDMRDFNIGKIYDLVMIPFRPLQHLFTIEDQIRTFESVARHLPTGGHFAFNVFYPNYALLENLGIESEEMNWIDPEDPTILVKRFFIRKSVDKLHQTWNGEFIFRSYRNEKLIKEERSSLNMSYYTYPHIQLLLKIGGFETVEEYGSFTKEPIDICNEMIFIVKKK